MGLFSNANTETWCLYTKHYDYGDVWTAYDTVAFGTVQELKQLAEETWKDVDVCYNKLGVEEDYIEVLYWLDRNSTKLLGVMRKIERGKWINNGPSAWSIPH